MGKALKEFIHQIHDYSDKELIFKSIYDAALFTDSEIGFDILSNAIIDEVINRDLSIVDVLRARDFIKKIPLLNTERRERLLSELKWMPASGRIWSAPEYEDLMALSKSLNYFETTDFDPDKVPKIDPMLPSDYFWNQKGGIIHRTNLLEFEDVYPGRIMVQKIFLDKNYDSDIPQMAQIVFECDGHEVIYRMTLEDLYNSNAVLSLANKGAFVNKNNSKQLAQFFSDYVFTFRSSIDKSFITQQIGWQDKKYKEFFPHISDCEYGTSEYRSEYKSIRQTSGTFKEWASLIKQFRDKNHIPFRIALASSFASVLTEPLMFQPFFLYIQGRSQFGKTPLLMVLASVWANPDTKLGYIKSLGGHDEALELGAQFYGSLPYCLNESQNRVAQKDNPSIDRLIYLLGDGTPKTRGKGSGGLRSQTSWCNAIILTGEKKLTSNSENLGVRTRVLDLSISDEMMSHDEKEIEALCNALSFQFNTAGAEFLRKLIKDDGMKKAHQLYEEYRGVIPKNVERRQNHIAATILTADTLIAKWIFEDSICLTVDDILPYLKTKPDESVKNDNESAQKVIDDWLRTELGEDFSKKSSKGRILKGTSIFVLFDDNVLVELLRTNGYNIEDYCKWAKANGKLAANEKNGYKRGVNRTKSDPKHSGHLYALVLPLSS